MMPNITLTNTLIRNAISSLGYGKPEAGKLHIVGVRGTVPINTTTLQRTENKMDRYDDSIIVFGTRLHAFLGSVDPGLTYTKKPLNPDGCAHLLEGGPYLYVTGLHRGHPALTQAGLVSYWRDTDRDGLRDNTIKELLVRKGQIGLNIHSGGASPVVGPHSASCQIIKGGWESVYWKTFYQYVLDAEKQGQNVFKYWLIDGKDL